MIGKNGEIGRIETHGGAPANASPDRPRIRHLLKLGVIASLTVLAGDMLLGWGVSDPSVTELPAFLARYLSVSDGRIAEAKKGDCPEYLTLEKADAMNLPYGDRSFDAVLIANALHVPEPEKVLSEIDRFLRPGGV